LFQKLIFKALYSFVRNRRRIGGSSILSFGKITSQTNQENQQTSHKREVFGHLKHNWFFTSSFTTFKSMFKGMCEEYTMLVISESKKTSTPYIKPTSIDF
jgi:hypothetical protein